MNIKPPFVAPINPTQVPPDSMMTSDKMNLIAWKVKFTQGNYINEDWLRSQIEGMRLNVDPESGPIKWSKDMRQNMLIDQILKLLETGE